MERWKRWTFASISIGATVVSALLIFTVLTTILQRMVWYGFYVGGQLPQAVGLSGVPFVELFSLTMTPLAFSIPILVLIVGSCTGFAFLIKFYIDEYSEVIRG